MLTLEAPAHANRPSPAELHENRIARKAAASLSAIQDQIVSMRGRIAHDLLMLNPDVAPEDRPVFGELRFTGVGGAWEMLSTGARGNDLIDLVSHLGCIDRPAATKYLAGVLARLN